jgi:hypothetical protein
MSWVPRDRPEFFEVVKSLTWLQTPDAQLDRKFVTAYLEKMKK